jgi:hypothetical protein
VDGAPMSAKFTLVRISGKQVPLGGVRRDCGCHSGRFWLLALCFQSEIIGNRFACRGTWATADGGWRRRPAKAGNGKERVASSAASLRLLVLGLLRLARRCRAGSRSSAAVVSARDPARARGQVDQYERADRPDLGRPRPLQCLEHSSEVRLRVATAARSAAMGHRLPLGAARRDVAGSRIARPGRSRSRPSRPDHAGLRPALRRAAAERLLPGPGAMPDRRP